MASLFNAVALTLFPEMFPGPLGFSLAGKALEKGIWSLKTLNIRDFSTDKHATVDASPYGGGTGMVMKPDVIHAAVEAAKALFSPSPPEGEGPTSPSPSWGEGRGGGLPGKPSHKIPLPPTPNGFGGRGPNPPPQGGREQRIIYLTPRGAPLTQSLLEKLKNLDLIILCGRFEGVDQRVIEHHGMLEISLGDFVLSGGEIAALALLDGCVRLLPGVIGKEDAVATESFASGSEYAGLLEYPHYTRPPEWMGRQVPGVLLSGNHEQIRQWRLEQAKTITSARRPDLIAHKKE